MTLYIPYVCTVFDAAVDSVVIGVGKWWRHWSSDAFFRAIMSRWKLKCDLKCDKMDQFDDKRQRYELILYYMVRNKVL